MTKIKNENVVPRVTLDSRMVSSDLDREYFYTCNERSSTIYPTTTGASDDVSG